MARSTRNKAGCSKPCGHRGKDTHSRMPFVALTNRFSEKLITPARKKPTPTQRVSEAASLTRWVGIVMNFLAGVIYCGAEAKGAERERQIIQLRAGVVSTELAARGKSCGPGRASRLLKQLGLQAIQPRSFRP